MWNCFLMRVNFCFGVLGFKYFFWIRVLWLYGYVCFIYCKRWFLVSGNECCKCLMMVDCVFVVIVWIFLVWLLWCCKWIFFLWRCVIGFWCCWFLCCGEVCGWSGWDYLFLGCCFWVGVCIVVVWGLLIISFKILLLICVDYL